MFWVCKMCGRSMKSERKPTFCYFDRTEFLENISEEDAEKMGLVQGFSFSLIGDDVYFEFPGDVKYQPFVGNRINPLKMDDLTLSNFQDSIMEMVRNAK